MTARTYRYLLTGTAAMAGATALLQSWPLSIFFVMLALAIVAHRARLSGGR